MAGIAMAFVALALLLYAPVLTAFFLSDDFFYLSQIVHLDWPAVLLLQPGVFRPLHVVTWLVDYRVWGLDPLGYHLTNIVSHGLTAIMVYVVAGRLFSRVLPQAEASWAAALAGLLFLVHPSHTEAVSWIIGRHDILAALFVLCAWYGYMRYRERSQVAHLAWSLGAFLIALLFKESPLSFPLVLAAYEGWLLLSATVPRDAPVGTDDLQAVAKSSMPAVEVAVCSNRPERSEGSSTPDARRTSGHARATTEPPTTRISHKPSGIETATVLCLYVLVVGVYLLLRRLTSGELVSEFESPFIRPSPAIFANLSATVFRSFLPYVPLQLVPEAPRLGLTTITVAFAGVLVIGAALLWMYSNLRRPTPVKLLISFLAVALVISAIPTFAFGRPSIIDSEGERYAYLPSVFASMLVGLVLTVLVKSRAVRAAVAAVVLLALGAFLELSNQNWRTAGELTWSVLGSVAAQASSDNLALLVVPDNLNGAFIYRNGLPEALTLFASPPTPTVTIAGRAFLRQAGEPVYVEKTGATTYAVSMPDARGSLVPAPGPLASGITTNRVDLYHFDVTLKRPMPVGYFSAGEMHFGEVAPD